MRSQPRRIAAICGALAIAVAITLLTLDPGGMVELTRARAYDRLLALVAPDHPKSRVVVIDIDRALLEREGGWPLRRERIARLIEAARAAGAAAIGVDILFAAPEAASTNDGTLVDDDARLAEALKAGGVALGFALDPEGGGEAPTTPILARGPVELRPWRGAGGVYPLPGLAKAAALGLSFLPGDADGVVRRAPLFAGVGGVLKPGLALETLRLARGAPFYLVSPARLVTGQLSVALPGDGMLRLAPAAEGVETLSAAATLASGSAGDLKDAIVFIGASAPEAGGLRATGDSPLTPSVVIQARAAAGMLAGFTPLESEPRLAASLGVALGGALVALAIFAPAPIGWLAALIALAAPFPASVAVARAGWLIDPLEISVPALAGFAASAAVMGAAARRRAKALRVRFERHLAPAVIERIIASGDQPKLSGERREITALFTDVEGFTEMVGRAEPEALVAALDGYFEGIARIGMAHGGMIDKFVGDAAHMFFNMPFDLADHASKALDCAVEIVRWSEDYRRKPGPAALGFGRTRVGIESGLALVGDVGGALKLDYTAHGDTVNAAARLEQVNKITGTAICLGPGASKLIAPDRVRPVGELTLRGFPGPALVFSPWPEAATPAWRMRYLAAFAARETADAKAAFAALASELDDPSAARLAEG